MEGGEGVAWGGGKDSSDLWVTSWVCTCSSLSSQCSRVNSVLASVILWVVVSRPVATVVSDLILTGVTLKLQQQPCIGGICPSPSAFA